MLFKNVFAFLALAATAAWAAPVSGNAAKIILAPRDAEMDGKLPQSVDIWTHFDSSLV